MLMLSEILAWLDIDHEIVQKTAQDCMIWRAVEYVRAHGFSDTVLYVADAGSYAPDGSPPKNLLLTCDGVTYDLQADGAVVLRCENNAASVCAGINAEMDRRAFLDHALSKVMDIARGEDFLERLIDYLYAVFQNPIAYFDYTHTVLTYREEEPTGIYIWDRSMENRSLDPAIVDDWFLNGVHYMVETKQILHSLFTGDTNYYACPVMLGETLFGFICILAVRGALTEPELELLHKTADLSAFVFNKISPEAGNGDFREIIKDILEDRIRDERELQVRLISRNWRGDKKYQLVAIDLESASREYTQYVLEGIDGISGSIKKLVHGHHVLVLLENSYRRNEVLAYAERYELPAGVSDVFERLMDIKTQFFKAKQALYIGRMLGHRKNVFHYGLYRFYDMLYAFQSTVRCDAYYHPIVGELEIYDKKNKTEFSKTLLFYLENGNSVHKASLALNLHKNTVNYRVQRIKELFRLDFENADEINHIFLSLKIRELDDILHAR